MNIKIDYKNKLHSIGKDITSIGQIIESTKTRYPSDFVYGVVVAVVDNGAIIQVKTFDEILDFWKRNGSGASVKLKVFEAPQNAGNEHKGQDEVFKDVPASYTESLYESRPPTTEYCLPQLKQDSHTETKEVERQTENQYTQKTFKKSQDLDRSFEILHKIEQPPSRPQGLSWYSCWTCKENLGLPCKFCNGKGIIDSNSEFLAFIDQIIDNKLKAILKDQPVSVVKVESIAKDSRIVSQHSDIKQKTGNSNIGKNSPDIANPDMSSSAPKVFECKFFKAPLNQVIAHTGESYTWNVRLTNSGKTSWPKAVYVYKISKKLVEITQIEGVEPGLTTEITLDLTAPSTKCVQANEFRLGYIDQSNDGGITFFGPKFGFQIDTKSEEKPQPQFPLRGSKAQDQPDTEMIKLVIQAAKYVSNQKHSIKSLVNCIKMFGLGPQTSKQVLVDVILELQKEKV